MTTLLNNRTILALFLAIELTLLIASIPYHELHGDEAWLAERSYFLAKDGVQSSILFKGYLGQDSPLNTAYWLFIVAGGVVFKTLGFGLFIYRLIPILSAIVLLTLLIKYQKIYDNASTNLLLISIIVFLLVTQNFYYFKVARPEMLAAMFGFSSFYCLDAGLRRPGQWLPFLSGAFAAYAALTHLNGLIFIFTGIIILLWQRKYSWSIFFIFAAMVAFIPLFLEIIKYWDHFQLQLSNPHSYSKTHFTLFTPLINLSREHQRLFRSPDIIFTTLLFLSSLVYGWKLLLKENKILLAYSLLLILFMGLLVNDKTIKPSVLLYPYWVLIIVKVLTGLKKEKLKSGEDSLIHSQWMISIKQKIISYIIPIILFSFTIYGIYFQVKDVLIKEDSKSLNAEIGNYIPEGSWCVAPMNIIFNEIHRLNIVSIYQVRWQYKQITAENLDKFCDSLKIEYAVFNKYGERIDDVVEFPFDIPKIQEYFYIIAQTKDYLILKRKNYYISDFEISYNHIEGGFNNSHSSGSRNP
jgi:hypothetical protein